MTCNVPNEASERDLYVSSSGDWTANLKLSPLGIPPRSHGGGCQVAPWIKGNEYPDSLRRDVSQRFDGFITRLRRVYSPVLSMTGDLGPDLCDDLSLNVVEPFTEQFSSTSGNRAVTEPISAGIVDV